MPDIRARIDAASGETLEIPASMSVEQYEYNKMDMCTIEVLGRWLPEQDLQEGQDEVYLYHAQRDQDLFGGILWEVDRHDDGTVELLVRSFEHLANRAQPANGDERWENASDAEIITDAISRVDGLSPGTINTYAQSVSFVFSHVSPSQMMRDTAEASPGYLRFNPDKTVDFQAVRDGTDPEDPPTLSPDSSVFLDEFEAEENGGDARATHLRLIGAREGEAQVSVEAVADWYDPSQHEEDWEVQSNKDVTDEETLQRIADRYINEIGDTYIEVSTTIDGRQYHIDLGQLYHVEHDGQDIDHDLRVVQVARRIDADGTNYETTLSSRIDNRKTTDEEQFTDIQRYNTSFEGTSVMPTASGGRQPVGEDQSGNDVNYEFGFYYPGEIVYEHRVSLQVKGSPYRAYSWGAATAGGPHNHDVELDITSADNADFEQVASQAGIHTTENDVVGGQIIQTDSFVPDSPTSRVELWGVIRNQSPGSRAQVHAELINLTTADVYPAETHVVNVGRDSTLGVRISDPTDCEGEELVFRVELDAWAEDINVPNLEMTTGPPDVELTSIDSTSGRNISLSAHFQGIGKHVHEIDDTVTSTEAGGEHSHPPEPGVVELFDGELQYPENCEVLVNGSSIGETISGGNVFEATVDLAGELQQGAWNTIEITSDSLGAIQATTSIDVSREILGQG